MKKRTKIVGNLNGNCFVFLPIILKKKTWYTFLRSICLEITFCQIRDDYINLTSTDYAANKSFAEDLTEGKFSFPILHAIKYDLGIESLKCIS